MFFQAEGNGIVRGGVAGVQGSDDVELRGHEVGLRGFGHGHVQELHPVKAQVGRQLLRGLHQWGAGFDAVDAAPAQVFEEQVVQDEAQVGLARAVVGQGDGVVVGAEFFQDGRNELVEVVHLLELAPRVLVELALAGEDVQRLEQFQALTGPQAKLGGHVLLRGSGRFGRFIFLHSGCSGCGR